MKRLDEERCGQSSSSCFGGLDGIRLTPLPKLFINSGQNITSLLKGLGINLSRQKLSREQTVLKMKEAREMSLTFTKMFLLRDFPACCCTQRKRSQTERSNVRGCGARDWSLGLPEKLKIEEEIPRKRGPMEGKPKICLQIPFKSSADS